jgi:hypothetical protein
VIEEERDERKNFTILRVKQTEGLNAINDSVSEYLMFLLATFRNSKCSLFEEFSSLFPKFQERLLKFVTELLFHTIHKQRVQITL